MFQKLVMLFFIMMILVLVFDALTRILFLYLKNVDCMNREVGRDCDNLNVYLKSNGDVFEEIRKMMMFMMKQLKKMMLVMTI